MPKRLGLICFLAFAALFLIWNRAAYKGYFQDDELDNISWIGSVPAVQFAEGLVTPRFQENNFRPVGHLYFYVCERLFGLKFPGWVAVLHAIHLLNVWLLWLLMRRLGAPSLAAGAACLFFGFHSALFDAVWKPMYAFDVLCATFCLLSILFYCSRRWVLAFVSFWLAYKAKEVAVMLPLVLAAAEFWFGKGEWKGRLLRLAPFFAASVSFGLQGILLNPNHDNSYTFHFTPQALAQTSVFYAGRVFLLPYAGFALPLAALLWRRPRVWFGLAAAAILFFPLLFLPGRIFGAYCYVPFTGLAVAFSGAAQALHPAVLAAFFLLWTPLDHWEMRRERKATLALDDQIRAWVTSVADVVRSHRKPEAVIWEGAFPGFEHWGQEGTLHYLYHDMGLKVYYIDDPEAAAAALAPRVARLTWNVGEHKLSARFREPPADKPYLEMSAPETAGQLGEGWYAPQGDYRWSAPQAVLQLPRPAGATHFELRLVIGPAQLRALRKVTVHVAIAGQQLDKRSFHKTGWQTAAWQLPPTAAGTVKVTVTATPYQAPPDQRMLGLAVGGIGFR